MFAGREGFPPEYLSLLGLGRQADASHQWNTTGTTGWSNSTANNAGTLKKLALPISSFATLSGPTVAVFHSFYPGPIEPDVYVGSITTFAKPEILAEFGDCLLGPYYRLTGSWGVATCIGLALVFHDGNCSTHGDMLPRAKPLLQRRATSRRGCTYQRF